MSEGNAAKPHAHPNYMAIFYALIVLTAVEVGIVYVPMATWALITGLMVLAIVKALLVAMYFMHLRFEGKLIYVFALVPLILIVIFAYGLMPDISNVTWHLFF